MLLILLLLALARCDVPEGDGALDLLAGEYGLIVPADEDADVARRVGRHVGVERIRMRLGSGHLSESATAVHEDQLAAGQLRDGDRGWEVADQRGRERPAAPQCGIARVTARRYSVAVVSSPAPVNGCPKLW